MIQSAAPQECSRQAPYFLPFRLFPDARGRGVKIMLRKHAGGGVPPWRVCLTSCLLIEVKRLPILRCDNSRK